MEVINYVLNTYEKHKQDVKDQVDRFIDDESIDLDDRVLIFQKACNLGIYPIDRFYHQFDGVDWNTHTLHDDFHLEKYSTFHFDTIVDIYFTEVKDDDRFLNIEDSIKYFFKKKIAGFINDW